MCFIVGFFGYFFSMYASPQVPRVTLHAGQGGSVDSGGPCSDDHLYEDIDEYRVDLSHSLNNNTGIMAGLWFVVGWMLYGVVWCRLEWDGMWCDVLGCR